MSRVQLMVGLSCSREQLGTVKGRGIDHVISISSKSGHGKATIYPEVDNKKPDGTETAMHPWHTCACFYFKNSIILNNALYKEAGSYDSMKASIVSAYKIVLHVY